MFLGFDHVDTRVASIAAVEPFYDSLMPLLGLPAKRRMLVDHNGNWSAASDQSGYNTVEYYEEAGSTAARHFIGFIEDRSTQPSRTRIAFRVERQALRGWEETLHSLGARNVECSADMTQYPAIFFEDPGGTKLEVCARNP